MKKISRPWLYQITDRGKRWEIRRQDDWIWQPGDWLLLADWVAEPYCAPGEPPHWDERAVLVRVQTVWGHHEVPGLRRGYKLLRISDPVAEWWTAPWAGCGRALRTPAAGGT